MRRRPWGRLFLCMTYYVYMLASRRHGTLYAGVTNDLTRRIFGHEEGLTKDFAPKYGVPRLV
jgi:putative endonuclease